MESRHAYDKRFQEHLDILNRYIQREGHAKVPAGHVENVEGRDFALGAWVSYQRSRRQQGRLSPERASTLEALQGWQWGPLRPGPDPLHERNETIRKARADGARLADLAQQHGLSRQRIHQIVTGA